MTYDKVIYNKITWVPNILLEPSTNQFLAYHFTNSLLSPKFLIPCTPAFHFTNTPLSPKFLVPCTPAFHYTNTPLSPKFLVPCTPCIQLLCALTPSPFFFLLKVSLDKSKLRKRRLPKRYVSNLVMYLHRT